MKHHKSRCHHPLGRVLPAVVCCWAAAIGACEPRADSTAGDPPTTSFATSSDEAPDVRRVLNAGFVVAEDVFNSELMAPYDIFHHTFFRDSTNYIRPFIVSERGGHFNTFEGLSVEAHHSFVDAPPIDILVIPSTANSMTSDLQNEAYVSWIREKASSAAFVVTLCDGAFALAATGLLDGRVATTFPGDRARFAEMFPEVEVRDDVNFVVDGKYVTSVGGALSYEPALFVVDRLYSAEAARRTAEGLVLEWAPAALPHFEVGAGRP